MAASRRVLPYEVTGTTGPVFPSPTAVANDNVEWGYLGFSLANLSSSTTYRIEFTDTTGLQLDVLELDPGETRSDWYGPQGITFKGLLRVTFTPDSAVGVVVGTVRVG